MDYSYRVLVGEIAKRNYKKSDIAKMNNTVKALVAAVCAAAGAYFRELLGPVLVLVAVMLLDYCTGMARAWASAELSSRVGVLGIIKKLLYLVAVAVAVVVDCGCYVFCYGKRNTRFLFVTFWET